MSASGFSAVPQLGFGQVRHARLKPVSNTFTYPTYFLMLPMRAMQQNGSGALAHNRSSLLTLHMRELTLRADGGSVKNRMRVVKFTHDVITRYLLHWIQ